MTTRSTDRTIVLNLLRGAVPERADEISRLWRSHGHEVDVVPSSVGSTMEATSKRIRFDTKTIDFFWLIGFPHQERAGRLGDQRPQAKARQTAGGEWGGDGRRVSLPWRYDANTAIEPARLAGVAKLVDATDLS